MRLRSVRWPRAREPLRVLLAIAAPVSHPLSAQESKVTLHARLYYTTSKVAVMLTLALAIENGSAQFSDIEIGRDRRQPLVRNGRNGDVARSVTKALTKRNVVHVLILDASFDQPATTSGKGMESSRVARAALAIVSVFISVKFQRAKIAPNESKASGVERICVACGLAVWKALTRCNIRFERAALFGWVRHKRTRV